MLANLAPNKRPRTPICRAGSILAFVALLGAPAVADEALFGRTLYTPPAGQLLCRDVDSLKAYLAATVGHDHDRFVAGCHLIGPGKELVVTGDLPSASDAMHMIEVRVFGVPVEKRLGYSISSGLLDHR